MTIEIQKSNLFDSRSEALILTIDGACRGMEGNIARSFARKYPDTWEELEYEIEYPIPLGSAKIYDIDPELECNHKHCIIASTLHHIETLSDEEKLKLISAALRSALFLASKIAATSVCTGVLTGGWRLEIENSLNEMIETYERTKTTSIRTPKLEIYVMGSSEFERISSFIGAKYPKAKLIDNKYVLS